MNNSIWKKLWDIAFGRKLPVRFRQTETPDGPYYSTENVERVKPPEGFDEIRLRQEHAYERIWSEPLTDNEREIINNIFNPEEKSIQLGEMRLWMNHVLKCYDALLASAREKDHIIAGELADSERREAQVKKLQNEINGSAAPLDSEQTVERTFTMEKPATVTMTTPPMDIERADKAICEGKTVYWAFDSNEWNYGD